MIAADVAVAAQRRDAAVRASQVAVVAVAGRRLTEPARYRPAVVAVVGAAGAAALVRACFCADV